MHVKDILKAKGSAVITVHADVPITGAVDLMHSQAIGSLVVIDDADNLVGLLTERDIVTALARDGAAALQRHVADLMNAHVVVCRPTDTLKDIMYWMTRHRIRHLPVVDDGRLCGIVSIGDVVKRRLEEMEMETTIMRELYIASH